jgi:hypothetical protein
VCFVTKTRSNTAPQALHCVPLTSQQVALMHHGCVLRCEEIPPAPSSSLHPPLLVQVVRCVHPNPKISTVFAYSASPTNRYIKDSNSGSVSLYGHPFMLQCCRTDSPRTLRSLIQPIAGVRRDACCRALYPADYPPGSSIRLRRLDPSLKPLSFDSVSQISTASSLNGDAGLEWLGLERVSEGSQQDGREANEVMVAAEAAAAAAPMSARVMQQQQQQQQAATSLRLSSDPPSVPLSARGSGASVGAGVVSQQQPLSARARMPMALVRGGGSRNTDVVPDDDATNPQPAANRSQQQHPRLNVVLSGAQAGVQPRVPSLDLAAVNAATTAPPPPAAAEAAAAAAAGHGVSDSVAEVVSARRAAGVARAADAAAAGSVGARVGEAAPGSARVEGVSGGAGHRDVKRDVVSSSNISELRSKVLSCQEEVQKMKEYALELEQDNASLKKVRRAAASRCHLCSKLCPRPPPPRIIVAF